MHLPKLFKFNFFKKLSEEKTAPDIYDLVYNNINSEFIQNNIEYKLPNNHLYIVSLIPPYYNLKLKETHKYSFFEVLTHEGFLADFRKHKSFDLYVKSQFNSSGRKLLKRRLNRLEKCFNIRYEVFYGEINIEHYNFLFQEFKLMLEKRFQQRQQNNESLGKWGFYTKSAYQLILEKKASLFVVFNNDKPIAVSLNFLNQNIFTSAIDSYDIDYSKFGLGNILIQKKMQWCYNNGFSIFNMGYGYLKYKRDWCNSVYKFKSQIVFIKKNFIDRTFAFIISKLILLMIVYKTKIKKKLSKMKSFLLSFRKQKTGVLIKSFNTIDQVILRGLNLNSTKIDINTKQYAFLRKATYDFQYLNSLKHDGFRIFVVNNKSGENIYLLKGKDITAMLS